MEARYTSATLRGIVECRAVRGRPAVMSIATDIFSRVPVKALVPAVALQYRLFEPELRHLGDFVPADRNAVDAGVWWGPWSWWLSRRAPHVDSFEPNPSLVAKLRTALPGNVTLHQVALSDEPGETTLWLPPGGAGTEGRASLHERDRPAAGWRPETTVTARLDDFELHNVGFIKIDVEGHELAVLRGAVETIERERPNLMVEVEGNDDRDDLIDAVIEFFAERSYSGQYVLGGKWHPISDLDRVATRQMADKVAKHGMATNMLLYARHYVHNFVFKPVG